MNARAMKFFADTAEIDAIQELAATGLLDGVTTNPSLIAKSGRNFKEVTKEICALVDGPVPAEVVALDHAPMMKRSEERGVGKECVRTGSSRWSPAHKKKKK